MAYLYDPILITGIGMVHLLSGMCPFPSIEMSLAIRRRHLAGGSTDGLPPAWQKDGPLHSSGPPIFTSGAFHLPVDRHIGRYTDSYSYCSYFLVLLWLLSS
jgi:hypothetical protein